MPSAAAWEAAASVVHDLRYDAPILCLPVVLDEDPSWGMSQQQQAATPWWRQRRPWQRSSGGLAPAPIATSCAAGTVRRAARTTSL
jgi:hypothetical protein